MAQDSITARGKCSKPREINQKEKKGRGGVTLIICIKIGNNS